MLIEYTRINFTFKFKVVNTNILYKVKAQSFEDLDLVIVGSFSLHHCLIPLKYRGFKLFVGATLQFQSGENGETDVSIKVTDDKQMLEDLKQIILNT